MNLVTKDSDSLKQQINEKISQDPTFSEGVDPVVVHEVQNIYKHIDVVPLTKTITESVTAAVLSNLKTLGVIPGALSGNSVVTAPSSNRLKFPCWWD